MWFFVSREQTVKEFLETCVGEDQSIKKAGLRRAGELLADEDLLYR